ncbi:MAG: type II toxin-antitoxin system VapC family toxin [Candidatus Eremiobacteraeota bacterium]|nr:type II toxin-antitoxin system VapC family toxin [Candidatus Eremiobacteraeota bacterium]MCW5868329.1 type II toxin-antitoxin system VapC family toxin [Candidatus Eremiobacteraeota bacterium]
MKLLLDTHVWLWSVAEPEQLGPRTTQILSRLDSEIYLSAVSAWEAAIKWGLRKLSLPGRPEELVRDSLAINHFRRLEISHSHGCGVADLPDHHRDPFDRLLISQALCENLTLLTADNAILAYRVPILWALD